MMLCKVLPYWLLLALCLAQIFHCSPIPKESTSDEKVENDNKLKNGKNTTIATEQHVGETGKNTTNTTIEDPKPKMAQESGALEPGAADKAKSGLKNKTENSGNDAKQEGKEKDKKASKTAEEKGKEGKVNEKETKKTQIPKEENEKERIKKNEVANAADIFNQMYEPFNIVGAENTPAALLSISGLKIENGKILSSNVGVFQAV